MQVDLLSWAQMIQSTRIQELGRTRILRIIANIFHKQACLLCHFFSITKVVSVMRLVVSSEGRKNSVSMPLRPSHRAIPTTIIADKAARRGSIDWCLSRHKGL